jgi:hypothetical protein
MLVIVILGIIITVSIIGSIGIEKISPDGRHYSYIELD